VLDTFDMPSSTTIDDNEVRAIDAYWRAANYLTVGQIFLLGNALLREPLRATDIKPRLLGHWGTSPGLSFIYAHVNRAIRRDNLDVIFLAGPGHGGPAILANVYLEGVYSEVYPRITEDEAGMTRLFRQFSTPGGVPSHVGPTTPGSIHEGGDLGYVLSHAFGAVFDHPELIAIAVVGDGEAETGPLEGSWKSIKFINAARDGAVLPILHLNGYKISGPTVLGRQTDESIASLLEGHGYDVQFVEGAEPMTVHRAFAATLDGALARIRAIQDDARSRGVRGAPRWPLIVLRTPKGWTGPKLVGGLPCEGTFRAHQVPLPAARRDPTQLAQLEAWLHSYQPERLFDAGGRLLSQLRDLAPRGARRMSANPHANAGGEHAALLVPPIVDYALDVPNPATIRHESTRVFGEMLADVYRANPTTFRLFCPDETNSNRLGAVFDHETRCWQEATIDGDDRVGADGRVMEVLSEHNCEGWLEGYVLTGRHGVFATYEAFALIVASMATQHAKWLEMSSALAWRVPVPSLNFLLTSTCWRNDHNGFSHQGPGFMDTIVSKKGTVARVYLPPDANCLLSVADHCLRSTNYVNLIIIDKQPQLQWLDASAAAAHCARGTSVWDWASTPGDPDVVLACAGDTPTLEIVAAAAWLRSHAPELAVRVVNVVDLMKLFSPREHPHGMTDDEFEAVFTRDTHVVFSFHGYAGAIHQLLHARTNPSRFHVRGYKEEGTTTTPFEMVVVNETSRYHLAIDAIRRSKKRLANADALTAACRDMLAGQATYVAEHFEDLPEIADWTWA
jgi:xylulose-5-phosphate/fructose-6-phosphate phosphoketolase